MNPALIIQAVLAGIEAAPKVIDVFNKGKAYIQSLFDAGVITKEQQDKVHTRLDVLQDAWLKGEIPPAFVIDPD